MLVPKRHVRAILGTTALVFGLTLAAGCGNKQEEASAKGYYEGPMKPKGAGSDSGGGGKKTGGVNNSTAAGQP